MKKPIKKEVVTPRQAMEIAKKMLLDEYKEHFITLQLNARNKLISAEITSVGTLEASLVHPREVFRPAVINHSSAIIVLHNHPSGETEPSKEDLKVTERLKKAGEILGIEILDHIIFSREKFTSLKATMQL